MSEQPRRRRRQIETDAEPVVEPSEPKMKGYSVPENKETIDYEPRQRANEKKPRPNDSRKMSQINKTRTLILLAGIYTVVGAIRTCLSPEISFIEMLGSLFFNILWIFSICGIFIFEEKKKRIPSVVLSILILLSFITSFIAPSTISFLKGVNMSHVSFSAFY